MNLNPPSDSIDLAGEPDFTLGNLRVRPSLREVSKHGRAETLEPRVMQVLVAFSQQRGEVISRDRLVERCWGGRAISEDAVNRCIARIRRLSEAQGGFAIETIPRVGYRLTEEAAPGVVAAGSAAASEVPAAQDSAPRADAAPDTLDKPGPQIGARRTRRFLFGAGVALVLIAIGVLTIYPRSKEQHQAASVAAAAPIAARKPRLAVLPFQNLSSDPANAFFTDGMHAEIISALAMRGGVLDVVPRTTMLMYRADPQAVAKVAADLDASHVMEGSMRREADSVRLTVQLFDVRRQAYVWSHNYNRKLVNALTLQSDVAREIAAQLALAVAPVAPKLAAPTANPQAYDLYLRARILQEDDSAEEAIAPLDRALALDPSFGLAYAARAQSHHALIVDNIDDSEKRLSLERSDVDAARRLLGAEAPLVLSLEALYLDLETQDHGEAIRRLDAAEAAGLSDSTAARQKAMLLMLDDRLDESIVLLQSLAVRDPGNQQTLTSLASELGLARRPIEALQVRNLAIGRAPYTVFTLLQGRLIFGFTGRTQTWRTALDKGSGQINPTAAPFRTYWDLLRFEKRYADLEQMVYSVNIPAVRTITSGGFSICCVGRRPTAVFRGWAHLLNEDRAAAAAEGNAVLNFVTHEPPTRWNQWFLRTLAAEGSLLTGNKQQAIVAAHEALALMPRKLDTLRSRYASAVAARVLAWAGAEDEAVALLEQLAILKPGLGPAEIARDPLYFIPLARNARYQTLVARLEIQMKNYDAEFRKIDAVK